MKLYFIVAALLLVTLAVYAAETPAAVGRDAALTRLMEGNARSAAATPAAWAACTQTREALTAGQHPIACVVTCSDSRVIPEMIFDQSLGSLFVVRTLGNVPSAEVVASVEYAVAHLHVPLVVVLGHTDCDAAIPKNAAPKAGTMSAAYHGGAGEAMTASDAPVMTAVDKTSGTNARLTAMTLFCESNVISEAVAKHETSVIAGLYDINTGKATFETELSSVSLPTPKVTAPETVKPAVAPAAAPAKAEVAATQADKPESKPASKAPEAAKPEKKKTYDSASFARRLR